MRMTVLNVSRRLASMPVCVVALTGAPVAVAAEGTTRVSVSSAGAEANAVCRAPSISATGRFVAFDTSSSNLVMGDANLVRDIFVRDRLTSATTRVSVSSAGAEANNSNEFPSISADGRFVAFQSIASTLVPGDTNGDYDIFVHDRQSATTTRVSLSSAGAQGDGTSARASISADGRFVAFDSRATTLVANDFNSALDVFVHDRATGTTSIASVTSAGAFASGHSVEASISGDGRHVAFSSFAADLVPGDTNGSDTFVHDRQTGVTTRVSVNSSGAQANSNNSDNSPAISGDGRFVTFLSNATDLVTGDTNGVQDVFLHDRQTGATTRVSVDSTGFQGNAASFEPAISADGRFIAFWSSASNLVPGDTNAMQDSFLHDRLTGTTTRVSLSTAGAQGNSGSFEASISAGGSFVAFRSSATNLVPGDTSTNSDIFVRDRGTCSGDANGDGAVDFIDLNLVLSDFGLVGPGLAGDLDGDGDCDFLDLNVVLGSFGVTC